MRITVRTVAERQGEVLVSFDCSIGQGIGVFYGVTPKVGDVRTVELGSQEAITEGVNLMVTGLPLRPSMVRERDHVVLTGVVRNSMGNGGMEIGLGDSIMLLDVPGKALAIGAVVKLAIHKLELHDAQV